MPRYLGLDYLTEAFNQRRNFLNKSVLTVPQHLEYVEKYGHSGFVSDSIYRLPWKRAKPDKTFLSQEAGKAKSDIELLTNGCRAPEIEKICSKRTNEIITDSQFIPSSNPASQESFPGITVLENSEQWKSFDVKSIEYEEEVFAKVDMQSDHEEYKLEDFITEEPLSDYLLNLPSINNLLCRLQKYNITDPLLQQDLAKGPTALLNADVCLQDYSNVKGRTLVDDGLLNEQFEKVNLFPKPTHKEELEEVICETELPPLIEPGSVKHLTNGLTAEVVDKEPTISEVLEKLAERKPTAIFNVECLPTVDKEQFNFVDINGGCEFAKVCSVEPLLIEPMLETTLQTTKEDLLNCLGKFTPKELSQEDVCFLSPQSKDVLCKAYWKEERFLNESLPLRLKEPNIPSEELTLESTVVQMFQVVSLRKLNISLDDELNLMWDPLRKFKTQTRSRSLDVEPADVSLYSGESNFPLMHLTDYYASENFEKYPTVILHDWSDPVLPQPVRDSGFGALKAAILARQQKDKQSALPSGGKSKEKKRQSSTSTNDNITTKVVPFVDRCDKFSEDPLNDFLMMRSTQITSHAIDPSPQKEKRLKPNHTSPEKRSRVVTVTFTDEYAEVAEVLLEFSQPILNHLFQTGVLPEHQHLSTIPPDMTRFLIKQNQKQNKGGTTEKAVLLLHVVSCVYNVYLHCTLEAAIFCLSAMEQKYQQQIEGELTSLQSRLFQMQCLMKDKRVLHPKLREILTYTEDWLQRKKRKDPDFDPKILVIVRRDIDGLLPQICQTLASSSFLQPAVYSNQDKDYTALLSRLDTVNCVITPCHCVEESFPWSQFSLVIEHEHQAQTGWLNTCQRQNIRYLGLKVDVNRVNIGNRVSKPRYENPSPQLFMVCSQGLTTNTTLLQLLESRNNCVLIERDNSRVKTDCHFADIILDVKTGITLQNVDDLSQDGQVEELFNKLTSFHLKFSQFWLLLYTTDTNNNALDRRKSTSLSRLQRALSTFSSTAEDFCIEVMMCKDVTEVAKVICALGESLVKTSDPAGQASQIDNRQFTAEEKHLLLFPCFNALSVQLILKTSSLGELIEMSLEDLITKYAFLPNKVTKHFHRLKSSTAVVQLEETHNRLNPNARDRDDSEVANIIEYTAEYNIQSENGFTQEPDRTLKTVPEKTSNNIQSGNRSHVTHFRSDQDMANNIHSDVRSLTSESVIVNRANPKYYDVETRPDVRSLTSEPGIVNRANPKYYDVETRPDIRSLTSEPGIVNRANPKYYDAETRPDVRSLTSEPGIVNRANPKYYEAETRPDVRSLTSEPGIVNRANPKYYDAETRPDVRSLTSEPGIVNRANPKYYDTNQTCTGDNERRLHSAHMLSESDHTVEHFGESRPHYGGWTSQKHGCGVQNELVSTSTSKHYNNLHNFEDTKDGYGDFQISTSPNLEVSEPAQNSYTYNREKLKDDSPLPDSEELSFPKPNEFTMAEIEGKVDTASYNNQEAGLETKAAQDTTFNRMTHTGNTYPEPFTSADKQDHRIVNPEFHHPNQSIHQYEHPTMNIGTSKRNLDSPSENYSRSKWQSRYHIGHQQSRLVSRDESSSKDFSHLTTSTILAPVIYPQLSKKKLNHDNDNSSDDFPGVVKSANCRRFNSSQESYVEDFLNSIRNSNSKSQDGLSSTSQGERHSCSDDGKTKVYNYDLQTLQGFNQTRNSDNCQQRKPNNSQVLPGTVTNTRFSNDHTKLDTDKERSQEFENVKATSRNPDKEYFELSNYDDNIRRRFPELPDPRAVKDTRFHNPEVSAVTNRGIRSQSYDATTDIQDLSFQLPAHRPDGSSFAEQQVHPVSLPGSLTDNHRNQYRSAEYQKDQFENLPSSIYRDYNQTGSIYNSQQHSLRPQYRGAVSNNFVQSVQPLTNNAAWGQDHRSGATNYRNPRYPPHRVSIGLAQPFPRNPQSLTEQPDSLNVHVEDSPPMDLDYDIEPQLSTNTITQNGSSRHGLQIDTRAGCISENQMTQYQQQRLVHNNGKLNEPEMLSLIPSKRRRLGLEKVPGSRGGQTRLSFS